MKAVVLILCSGLTAAVNPISSNVCQCTSTCDVELSLFKWCDVDVSVCTDAAGKASGQDKCGTVADGIIDWANQVAGWFTGSEVQNFYNKIGSWAAEHIQAIKNSDIAGWAKDQLSKIPTSQIAKFTNDQLAQLNIDELLKAGTQKVAELASEWDRLSSAQLDKLAKMAQKTWEDVVSQIPMDQIASISKELQDKFPADKLQELKNKIASITLTDVATWTGEQWQNVPIDNLALMSWQTLQQIPIQEIGRWTQEQWQKMPVDKLVKLTGDQIAKIDPEKLGDLSQKYWDMVPVYHIVKISTELLQSLNISVVAHLNASNIAYLSAQQWQAVPLSEITSLTADKLKAINYTSLGGFTKEMWDALPIEKLANFAGKQIEQIDPEVVGKWTKDAWLMFDASAAVMFTGEQLQKGASALKDLAEEELSKFDWAQLSADALAQLPPELRAKVEGLLSESKTAFKDLVAKAQDTKDLMDQAYLEWQTLLASSASVAAIQAAKDKYDSASADHDVQAARLLVETNKLDGIQLNSATKPVLAMVVIASVATQML